MQQMTDGVGRSVEVCCLWLSSTTRGCFAIWTPMHNSVDASASCGADPVSAEQIPHAIGSVNWRQVLVISKPFKLRAPLHKLLLTACGWLEHPDDTWLQSWPQLGPPPFLGWPFGDVGALATGLCLPALPSREVYFFIIVKICE